VRFKCIALRVASSDTWFIELAAISCYCWVFPDILDGLEQRWCWARDWRLFRASPSDCEGFLSLSRGSSQIGYSSRARGLEDLYLVSGCAAPAEGLTLDSQLARDPSSGCIATTRSSLPESKWTSVKIPVQVQSSSQQLNLWRVVWTNTVICTYTALKPSVTRGQDGWPVSPWVRHTRLDCIMSLLLEAKGKHYLIWWAGAHSSRSFLDVSNLHRPSWLFNVTVTITVVMIGVGSLITVVMSTHVLVLCRENLHANMLLALPQTKTGQLCLWHFYNTYLKLLLPTDKQASIVHFIFGKSDLS
jgi:hypothetical protein